MNTLKTSPGGGKRTKILIASVLKPVDDTRMFEKIGMTLAENGYEVHVAGFPSSRSASGKILIHQSPRFKRISAGRVIQPWKVLRLISSIRPSLLIITTHELLWIAVIAKWLYKTKVIYDVQENYFMNIWHTRTFPLLIKNIVALWVRMKELMTSPAINHFLFAERAYQNELPFISDRFTQVENKFKRPAQEIVKSKGLGITLLFSGTIAESTGVFIAVDLAAKLHAVDSRITMKIVGYCARPGELKNLRQLIAPFPFIQLIGGDQLVPHPVILEHISQSDFGIVSYPFNRSTYSSIPTKLYEYLGMELPVLLIGHKPWVELCAKYDAAITFDAKQIEAASIIQQMTTPTFYSQQPDDVYWDAEEPRLLEVIKAWTKPT